LRAKLVLIDMVPYEGGAYRRSGNRLLDEILGAEIEIVPPGANPVEAFRRVMGEIEAEGRKPYFVPTGGSNALGSLGYARAYIEIAVELDGLGISKARIVHASSSGGTQAGLMAGAALRGKGPSIHGVNVYRADHDAMAADIAKLAGATAELLGAPAPAPVRLEDGFLGPRYGVPTDAMVKAVECVARNEAILLDPVYTGKAMAGLLALVRARSFSADETVVFLHTGGMPGLFAYEGEFLRA
jgi:D-cysteine desulfhydrase/L-cysteate sulfo-lyase